MLKLSTDGWMDSQGAGEISNVKVVNRWMDSQGAGG